MLSLLNFRSGFFWFCQDERQVVRGENPGWGVGDIAKELGRRWGGLGADLKAKYDAMAQKDKKRYETVSMVIETYISQ